MKQTFAILAGTAVLALAAFAGAAQDATHKHEGGETKQCCKKDCCKKHKAAAGEEQKPKAEKPATK